ncbi:MAG TPA: ECF-type sigma factor, partial [Vicinamibacterales bacterium]
MPILVGRSLSRSANIAVTSMSGRNALEAAARRGQVTDLLVAWGGGEEAALAQLVPIVHDELRRLASRQIRAERRGHTLQTTALVNEAYLRLVDLKRIQWQDRTHFFSMSSRLMRRILVDHARARNVQKRGGGTQHLSIDEITIVAGDRGPDLEALDDALNQLATVDPRKSQIVELRFFAGLGVADIALA